MEHCASSRCLRSAAIAALAAGALATSVAGQQLTQPATGSRMVVLLFDLAMSQEDIRLAAASGVKYADDVMTSSDMVAIVTIGSRLNVLTDFTSDRTQLTAALGSLTGGAAAAGDAGNDVRLRAIKTLCETLTPISQKKAVLYFSSGMTRNGDDNGIEVRAATNTCNRGNVSLYPVDARGLAAAVAGGGATNRSSGGRELFTGAVK